MADGCNVRHTGPHVVERAAYGTDRLELVKPARVITECNLYRGFASEYLVERPDVESPQVASVEEPAAPSIRPDARKADSADVTTLRRLVERGPRLYSRKPWSGTDGDSPDLLPPGRRERGARPEVGDVVLFDSAGYWRPAVVTKVGRVNLRVAYMTPHGLEEVERGASWPGVLGCPRRIAEVYVVTGEEWAQRAIAGE